MCVCVCVCVCMCQKLSYILKKPVYVVNRNSDLLDILNNSLDMTCSFVSFQLFFIWFRSLLSTLS